MKKNLFFSLAAGVALTASLASCSDNQGVDTPNVGPESKGTSYALIKINMPGVSGTRSDSQATKDEDIDPGTTAEATVNDIQLALYDANGNYVGYGELASDMEDLQGEDNNISDTYNQIFKLHLNEGGEDPTQVVAFINFDVDKSNLDVLADQPVSTYEGNGFYMTNSGYYDGDKWMVAQPFDYTESFTDINDATNYEEACEIWVERLAVKVNMDIKKDTQGDSQVENEPNYDVKDVAGTIVKLVYTPTKWGITGKSQSEYKVKKSFVKNDYAWANKSSDHRSWWATGVHWDKKFEEYLTDGSVLTYLTFGDLKNTEVIGNNVKAMGSPDYTLEHTTDLGIKDANIAANTYAIVTGKYGFEDNYQNAGWFTSGSDINFYLLLSGENNGRKQFTIYNESQLIGLLLSYNGIDSVKDENSVEYPTKTTKDVPFNQYLSLIYDFDSGKYKIGVKEDAEAGKVLTYGENNDEINEDVIEGFNKYTNSRNYYFPKGGAYFNVPIATNTTNGVSTYGVVRNHSYVLTINKIENLGAPLDENQFKKDETDDPDPTPVVPDPDDFLDHYINAVINVLSWHVVENGVIL